MSELYEITHFQGELENKNRFAGYITNTGVVFNAKLSQDGKIGPPGPEGPPGPQGPQGDIDEDEVIDIIDEQTQRLSGADIINIFTF